ncbi:MAG TPA: OadG family protein [Bacteroidales bacterium]|nr:OadG family protein [Bacteroidales bacterium]
MNSILLLIQTGISQTVEHTSANQIIKHDPYGVFLAIMSIALVMIVLTCIYLAFKLVTKLAQRSSQALSKHSEMPKDKQPTAPSGEVNAVIGYALHLYMLQLADEENRELTIKRMAHRYSPWSSKIHTLRRNPGQYN